MLQHCAACFLQPANSIPFSCHTYTAHWDGSSFTPLSCALQEVVILSAHPPPATPSTTLEPATAAAGPLPLAPDAQAATAEAQQRAAVLEARRLYEEDQAILRAMRMALRNITITLLGNRRYAGAGCR